MKKNRKEELIPRLPEKDYNRFLEAKDNFQRLKKEIAPFTKKRKFKEYSTAGEWHSTSSLIHESDVSLSY